MRNYDNQIIVVGAGAAGLMAAGQIASAGAPTLLLERMGQPGRKLNITGKGRCNLTNSASLTDFLGAFGPNGRFLRQAFSEFFSDDLVSFLEELGVSVELERGGRFFPTDNRAADITIALTNWGEELGVELVTGRRVKDLLIEDGRITGLKCHQGSDLAASAVVIATGGRSYPGTGSTGDGLQLAHQAGHKLIRSRPALVPIETEGKTAADLQGLSLRNVVAAVLIDGRRQHQMLGEMIFTHYGLSGPIILHLSREIVDALAAKHEVEISIDLKPGLTERQLEARLLRDFRTLGKKQLPNILSGLLPSKLIGMAIKLLDLPPDVKGNQITVAERRQLRHWLKDFRFRVTGHRPFEEAIITAGGVALNEVDPRTMASRLVDGLYFAGELLDLDACTGGYNLQAAFSTGWLAGRSAAVSVMAD